MKKTLVAVLAFAFVSSAAAQPIPPQAKERAAELVGQMTLDEKIDYIGGYNEFYIRAVPRLGIPEIRMADGPQGVRNNTRSTMFPCGVAAAATWDRALVRDMGRGLGQDARARGVHIMLGPGVNIYRSPLCGRNFEYFGEDPYLASETAVQYIEGMQSEGVMATIKHFAGNNQEWDRHQVSSDIDERTLHEIYLPAFRKAVEQAGVGAVMSSYNLVNGQHATENEQLAVDILRGMWGFEGIFMSDWNATYSAEGAANRGLDLEMPSARFMNARNLRPLIESGVVSERTIDLKCQHILQTLIAFGFLDRQQLDPAIPEHNPFSDAAALDVARGGVVLLKNDDRRAIDMGLKYVNNDACFPSITVVGQLMEAVTSGRYDTDHLALMMTQTGGCCRASNYVGFIRRALEKAGYGHIPVVSVNLNGMEKNEGFTLSKGLIMDAVHALVYGDLFMRCLYHVRPYELEKGSAEAIHQKWKEICVDSLVNPKTKWRYADVCRGIVADFDALPIDETLRKPCVGIVGEILVKYMPLANNHLVELLEAEGAEAVVPDLLDFFNYSIYGRDFRHKNLGTSWKDSVVAKAGVEMLRRLRAPALEALEKSRRFEAPMPIEDVAKLAEPFLAIGNQYGEGWFLTGEMAELLTSGTPNIVCIQPFACLPNHVVGKGVIKALRKSYPWANIVAVDYDPGASEVNQLNRIKLMLSSARRAMHSGAAQDAEALPIAR